VSAFGGGFEKRPPLGAAADAAGSHPAQWRRAVEWPHAKTFKNKTRISNFNFKRLRIAVFRLFETRNRHY